MRKIVLAGLVAAFASTAAIAAEEPFGPGFDGWKFTQEARGKGVLCRAILGNNLIARHTDGGMYVSSPAGKVAKGKYPETYFEIGGESEPANAQSDGKRFWILSDEGFLIKLAKARGYAFRTGPVKGRFIEGRIAFNASTGKALGELKNCTRANGGV